VKVFRSRRHSGSPVHSPDSRKKKRHSSFYKDIRIIQIVIVILTLALTGFSARLQFFAAERIRNRPFVDTQTLDIMNRLVRHGAIYLDNADRIVMDESSSALKSFGRHRIDRIRALLPFMKIRHGRPFLPESVVSMRFTASGKSTKPRGAILDRHLTPLAEGPLNQRRYPIEKAGYPVTGAAHSVYSMIGPEHHFNAVLADTSSADSPGRLFYTDNISVTDIILTVDASLQKAAYDAMEGYTGAVIVLDVLTGDILAAVSTPAFDPSDASYENWSRIQDTNLSLNRCWERRYPPGSTFKIVTAAALLESEIVDGDFTYTCSGRHAEAKVNEFRRTSHGLMNVSSAIRVSCNVFFCEAALRLKSELKTVAERMGFNRAMTLLPPDVPAVISFAGGIPSRIYELDERVTARNPDTGRIYFRERYSAYTHRDYTRNRGTTGRTGFGQGTVEATPLQMALVALIVANGGILREPNLVAGVRMPGDTKTINAFDATPGKTGFAVGDQDEMEKNVVYFDRWPGQRVFSVETAGRLASAMESVMTAGTGASIDRLYHHPSDGLTLRAWVPWDQCIRVAGKTGTAEVEGRQDHSWFISFAPVENPRYVVSVICEHAGLGGHHAGPVAMKIYSHLFDR
jgi:penicillin-binding protein A